MPEANLKPAFRMALRLHEIGNQSPYQLFFAGKGNSGASFGFMQGDLAAGQAEVTRTFRAALKDAGFTAEEIKSLVARLSVHLIGNPLSAEETKRVNAALLAAAAEVDAMDETILQKVYGSVDVCIEIAASATPKRTIEPKALLYMALWINMSGPPTKLLDWLRGDDPNLVHPVPKPGKVVDVIAIETYLRATSYYTQNPGNFQHMVQSVAAGATQLP
jgi:hypothetical protein